MNDAGPGALVFLETADLARASRFYREALGFALWKNQGACQILARDNLLLGFCAAAEARPFHGIITLFFPDRAAVDRLYEELPIEKTCVPRFNETFGIYQFFAKDPEGRTLEFQVFER
jgi:catechol 2,3-dioxygenase-like lactoylglutathione lyase family enzyme